jgi:hypothetical protein
MNTPLLSLFTPAVRRQIRDRLTLNWAGGYHYSFLNGILIEQTSYPSCHTASFDGKLASFHFQEAPPPVYHVIFGQSPNPEGDFQRGRKLAIWAKTRNCTLGPRLLGVLSWGPRSRKPSISPEFVTQYQCEPWVNHPAKS